MQLKNKILFFILIGLFLYSCNPNNTNKLSGDWVVSNITSKNDTIKNLKSSVLGSLLVMQMSKFSFIRFNKNKTYTVFNTSGNKIDSGTFEIKADSLSIGTKKVGIKFIGKNEIVLTQNGIVTQYKRK